MRDKKALSTTVEVVILLALTVTLASMVWVIEHNIVKGKIKNTGDCFGVFEKVTINEEYVCYEDSTHKIHFSISVGDTDKVDDIFVSISHGSTTTSFKIREDAFSSGLTYSDGVAPVSIPRENEGKNYIYTIPSFNPPTRLEIAPIINGRMCQGPNPITEFSSCDLLINQ